MNQPPPPDNDLAVQERIDAYLAGDLSPQECVRFEQDLADPDLAALFREALFLRTLLADLPPDRPPAHLVGRIQGALGVQAAERSSPSPSLLSWLPDLSLPRLNLDLPSLRDVIVPSYTVAGAEQSVAGWAYFARAFSQVLPLPAREEAPRPLWRRLVFGKR